MGRKRAVKHTLKIRKNERRKTQRLKLPLKINYRWLSQKGLLREIFTQDVSGGGMRLRSTTPFKKGDRLKTQLYFPNSPKAVGVVNEVIWCRKVRFKNKTHFDVGIKHLKISPRDRERFVFLFCEMLINFILSSRKQ
jgi:c-di-GMP-binding flagellar brake protein YcgR